MSTELVAYEVIFPYDFYHFWAAGRVALEGGNPYDVALVYGKMLSVGWPASEGFHGFLHPPWAIWIFALLGLFPFPIALSIWFILGIGCAAYAFTAARRLVSSTKIMQDPEQDLDRGKILRGQIFLFGIFPPLLSTLWNGQTNLLLLLGVAGFISQVRSSALLAGLFLSLLFIKPQLFPPFFAALVVLAIRERRIRIFFGVVIGLTLQVVFSLTFFPGVFQGFFAGVSRMSGSSVILPGASLAQTLHIFVPSYWVFPAVSGLAIVVALFLAWKTKLDWVEHLLLVSLPISLISAPYIWSHSFLPLIIPYLFWMTKLLLTNERLALVLAAFFAIFGLIECLRPHELARWMVVLPLGLLSAVLLAFRRKSIKNT